MQEIEIVLSDWVFNAIEAHEVLTIHRDYFRLRKPLERRMYELARKHCGRQAEWAIGLEKLKDKCGSTSTLKEFRRLVRAIAKQDASHRHMPDYAVSLEVCEDGSDKVVFRNRFTMEPDRPFGPPLPPLPPQAHDEGRRAAPGWDVHVLEAEWRAWCQDKGVTPHAPSQHFAAFCRSWSEHRGAP